MKEHVAFKDEDQDEDGMPIGPAWVVDEDGKHTPIVDGTGEAAWFRKSYVLKWASDRAYEVREV